MQETQDWGERKYNFSPLGLARAVKARDGIAFTEGSTLLDVCKALCSDGVFDEVFYPFTSYDQESFRKTGKLHFPSMAVTAEEEAHLPKYYCKNYSEGGHAGGSEARSRQSESRAFRDDLFGGNLFAHRRMYRTAFRDISDRRTCRADYRL